MPQVTRSAHSPAVPIAMATASRARPTSALWQLPASTVLIGSVVVGVVMSTGFLFQLFVWRNWPWEEVLSGWLEVARDDVVVAVMLGMALIAASRIPTRALRWRSIVLAVAILAGAAAGELVLLDAAALAPLSPALTPSSIDFVASVLCHASSTPRLQTTRMQSAGREGARRRVATTWEFTMNFAIQTIAVAALTLSAAPQSVFAADNREPSESVTTLAGSETPGSQIAQADTTFSSVQAAGARQRREPESPDPGTRGARVAASQGPEALRRYVDRTRMIYALDIHQLKVSQP